jgi:uncharacterized protein YggU (UPF0235/DUF167 family)
MERYLIITMQIDPAHVQDVLDAYREPGLVPYHRSVGVELDDLGGATAIPIYATPRAGRTEIAGTREGALWVRLAAPPVQGAANEALLRLLAGRLGVARGDLRLLSGSSGRRKRVRVGLPVAAVRQRLDLRGA